VGLQYYSKCGPLSDVVPQEELAPKHNTAMGQSTLPSSGAVSSYQALSMKEAVCTFPMWYKLLVFYESILKSLESTYFV
jgi:hypothetical protein